MTGTRDKAWLVALVEGMPQMIWRSMDGGAWTWSSSQWRDYTGQTEEQSRGEGWLEVVHPEDRGAAVREWTQASALGEFRLSLRIRRVDGAYRWFQISALPIYRDDGGIAEWIGTATDIDDLRRLQAEQKVLVGELQHRTRNLLAVVHAIATQTVEGSESLVDFQDSFDERLSALGRVQGLLSQAERDPITIEKLIQLELHALAGPQAQSRMRLHGPEIPIKKSAAQTLALAIHELSTNALKYGALSGPTGKLAVSWKEHIVAGGRMLRVIWEEAGVEGLGAVVPERRGYGRILIEEALPQQLGAATELRYAEGGVRCIIDLPYSHYGSPSDHE